MQRIHELVGIMLTMVLLGSSSGIASFTDNIPPDPSIDGEAKVVQSIDPAEQAEPEQPDEDQVVPAQGGDLVPEPEDIHQEPEDQVAVDPPDVDANPSTGPPADDESDKADPLVTEDASIETSDDESVEVASDETNDGLDIETVEPANTIQSETVSYTIVVSDRDDNLINGAVVTVTDYEGDVSFGTQTTVNGQVTFDLGPGGYVMKVSAAGYFADDFPFTIWEGSGPETHNVYLQPAIDGTFTIRVINWNTEEPVAGATVALRDSDNVSVASGITNSSGVYTTSGAIKSGAIYYTVSHPEYESRGGSGWIEGDTHFGDLHLSPIVGGAITLTIYDATSDDEPTLANVSIHIESWADNGEFTGTTDANGVVNFAYIPGGEYTLTANLDGYEERSEKLYVQGDAEDRIPMFQIIENPGKITLETYEAGPDTSLSGVVVVILDEDLNEVDRGTSVNGLFVSKELPFGVYTAEASKDGYHDTARPYLHVNGDQTYNIFLQKVSTGTATVQVLNANTDEPIAGASVTIEYSEQAGEIRLTTNNNGIVTFEATSFGYYSVDVIKDGYSANSRLISFQGEDTFTVYLSELEPGAATFVVRDRDSNALLAGAQIQVHDWESGEVIFAATTTASGTVTTPELPEDYYRLTITKDSYFPIDDSFTISGDLDMTFYLETIKPGVITVQALTQTDVPIAGANVLITEAIVDGITWGPGGPSPKYVLGETVDSGTTDANGRLASTVLESGSYFVLIEADGYELYSRVVHLNGDQVVSATMTEGDSGNPLPTPDPTETPVPPVTPDPTETPVPPVTPDPTETPVPPVTPDPTETPVPPVTPDPTETPVPPVTPDPTETPVPPVTPDLTLPTDPGNEDDEDEQDDPGQSGPTSVLTLSFVLCADENCDDTSSEYDGYTVSWTVTPLDTQATQDVDASKMAATGMAGSPVSHSMMQASQSFLVTGVLQNGVATGVSEPLLTGNYNVCLHAEITGPGGDVVTIAGQTTCTDLSLGAGGSTMLPFGGVVGNVIVGDPIVTPDETDGGTDVAPGDQPGSLAGDTVAQSADNQATDSSVTSLPNTGVGVESGSHGLIQATMIVVVLISILGFGTYRNGRRA